MPRDLQLEFSLTKEGFENFDSTYRDEGMSIGADHMRLYGEEIQLEVGYSDLIMGSRIGQGACSSVNLARHRRTGETYAVKLFNVYDRAQASQLYNEILLLTSFQCDALISLKGAFHDSGSIGVILEHMDRGSIEFLMESKYNPSEKAMASIAFQMIWGLGYLHYERQLHRDVKPGNVLMNSQGQVKLSDFGISKVLDNTTAMSSSAVGSYLYMSPERLLGDKYDASADVWSVGVSLMQLWQKRYPFKDFIETPIHLSHELQNFDPERWLPRNKYSSKMRQFLLRMLSVDPSERGTSFELTTHSWLSDFNLFDPTDAQLALAEWLRQYDNVSTARTGSLPPTSSSSSFVHGERRGQATGASAKSEGRTLPPRGMSAMQARDFCEMSLSLDASKTWNSEDFNRTVNPFMSSGSLSSGSYGNIQFALPAHGQAKAVPMGRAIASIQDEEEYESDFEEEVEAYNEKPEEKKSGGNGYSSYRK